MDASQDHIFFLWLFRKAHLSCLPIHRIKSPAREQVHMSRQRHRRRPQRPDALHFFVSPFLAHYAASKSRFSNSVSFDPVSTRLITALITSTMTARAAVSSWAS